MISLSSLTFVLVTVRISAFTQFGYADEKGPEKWSQDFHECSGKYQSPIDINDHMASEIELPPLLMYGTRDLPWKTYVSNNGHSVELRLKTDRPIQVSGGPLKGNYTFEQLHFHWGANDSVGSETRFNNKSFPMEIHVVFFKSEYQTMLKALSNPNSLAVLALFPELSTIDNRAYAELVDSLEKVTKPHDAIDLPYQLPLEYFLPEDKDHYYTYHGSLTTPPCLEIVTWIEFTESIPMSHSQIERFRQLNSEEGAIIHNYRPTQPLHGRPVFYNSNSRENSIPKDSAVSHHSSLLLSIVMLILIERFS